MKMSFSCYEQLHFTQGMLQHVYQRADRSLEPVQFVPKGLIYPLNNFQVRKMGPFKQEKLGKTNKDHFVPVLFSFFFVCCYENGLIYASNRPYTLMDSDQSWLIDAA